MEEYEVVNYSDEDSFESFYKRNKGKILKNLKGKKMKKRLLRNARKLLDESTGLPSPLKNNILLRAIEDTVTESESEGFEGEEFDHFRFAKKLRQKAEKMINRPIPRLSIKNILNKRKVLQTLVSPLLKSKQAMVAQNGQLTSPAVNNLAFRKAADIQTTNTATTTTTQIKEPVPSMPVLSSSVPSISVPSMVEKAIVQETKANTVASNGQLSFPKEPSSTQASSESKEAPVKSDAAGAGEEIKNDAANNPNPGEAGKEEKKITETKPEEKKDPEIKKGINKKWLWGGGIVVLVILIIILVVALKK